MEREQTPREREREKSQQFSHPREEKAAEEAAYQPDIQLVAGCGSVDRRKTTKGKEMQTICAKE